MEHEWRAQHAHCQLWCPPSSQNRHWGGCFSDFQRSGAEPAVRGAHTACYVLIVSPVGVWPCFCCRNCIGCLIGDCGSKKFGAARPPGIALPGPSQRSRARLLKTEMMKAWTQQLRKDIFDQNKGKNSFKGVLPVKQDSYAQVR